MGISATLSLAAHALQAQQAAIQTTGQNVANAATPGYSRQQVVLQTATPTYETGVLLGNGVHATVVRRITDQFAEGQLVDLNGDVGYSTAQQSALSAIEQVFPTSGGVTGALSDFFGALSDLATHPTDPASRNAVVSKATALGSSFQLTRQQLGSIQSNLDQNLQADTQQVNTLTQQIAALNPQVAFTEGSGQPANDARDQRQLALQELANLTGATVNEGSDGQVSVLAGNILLVSGNRAATLEATTLAANGLHQLQIVSPDGLKYDATSLFQSGAIGGVLQARDHDVAGVINQLDTLAKAVVDQVNTQHAAGFDYYGNAGGNLFQPIGAVATAAASVQVTSAVAADPNLIAAAQSAAGAPGDNQNAQALANLSNTPIAALGNATAQNYFLASLASIGAQAQTAQSNADFQNNLLMQVQTRRDGVSGVNVDEEVTNLILFQRAFEASSRLVATSDQLYQTLINMTR